MDSNGLAENNIAVLVRSVRTKVLLLNILFFAAGFAVSGIFLKSGFALSFVSGFVAGMLNQHIFFNIARTSVSLPTEKAPVFATLRFYTRLGLSLLLLFLLAWTGLNPWALIIGFSATLQSTILTALLAARKEFKNA